MKAAVTVVAVLLVLSAPAWSDTLVLKTGARLEGKVLSREKGVIVFQTRGGGRATFQESQVDHVVPGKTAEDDYAERAAKLAFTDVKGHFELAGWCKQQGLLREMRAELDLVLAAEPDHALARALLGQVKVGTRWLPRDEAMKAQGYVQHKGQWLKPEQVLEAKRLEAHQARVAKLQAEVNRLWKKMAGPSDKARTEARDELVALAKVEQFPQLAEAAGKMYEQVQGYWVERRRVVLEVRAQSSSIGQLRRLQTGLGTGLPVTIELPEVRYISVGTTVVLPGD